MAYQFDAANNRTLETITQDGNSSTKTYTYNDLDQLTEISSTDAEQTQVEYDYDGNGNLAQKRSRKTIAGNTQTEINDYAFDIRGQLKSVTMGGSSIGQFLYDDGGQRLRTQYNNIENGQPATQTYAQHSLYQGLKLISQYDLSENNALSLNANYQFASSNSGVMNIGRRAYNEDDTANNTQTYYHTDSLGSILATSKANKSIAARYDYDAWGKELNNTDTSDNPLGFTGHQMDRESENKTGLIYANARYLDPDTGRFLSFDPFEGYDEKPISLNKYLYAYQNPVRYTDPAGNYAELPLEIASIGVGLYSAASNYLDGDTDAALEDLAYVGADIALAVVPGAPGGLGMARQIAKEGAEAVTDAKKLDNVADTASNAKSATKTTKESSTSVNSKVESPRSQKETKPSIESENAQVVGPKGGKAKSTEKTNEQGETIYKRDSGGHYSNDASTGKQKIEKSPS